VTKDDRTPARPRNDSGAALHFEAGSALREFGAGRLGAPACWPNENHPGRLSLGASNEASSIQRWETEGGKTMAGTAVANRDWARPRTSTQPDHCSPN